MSQSADCFGSFGRIQDFGSFVGYQYVVSVVWFGVVWTDDYHINWKEVNCLLYVQV